MHGMGSKRYFQLGTVIILCTVISLVDYWNNGSFPLLTLLSSRSTYTRPQISSNAGHLRTDCECSCTEFQGNATYKDTDQDLYADEESEVHTSGASHLIEVFPMKTLKQNVNFNEEKGLQHLDHPSLSRYYSCKLSKLRFFPPNNTLTEKRCKERTFLEKQSPLVALISFHGSGNTWVRHLVEQATGIFTGSIYCDPGLKVAFPGEFVAGGNVIVIKTHQADTVELPEDMKQFTGKTNFDKAILIVRNPYDALVSEANRRWNSKRSVNDHLGVADETAFISNSKWDWLVEYKGATWAFLLHTWLAKKRMPVLVVQYEVLVEHTERELTRIIEFLNFPINRNDIKCAVENGSGMFKRTKRLDFNPYSTENHEAMNRYISQAAPILAQYGIKYDLREHKIHGKI